LERKIKAARELIRNAEACVMPGVNVLQTGVSKANYQFHTAIVATWITIYELKTNSYVSAAFFLHRHSYAQRRKVFAVVAQRFGETNVYGL
jgi:hypothetical protein